MKNRTTYFHLHMISDATGETLIAVGRAAAAQYVSSAAVEHVYPLVRKMEQLDDILRSIEDAPGIVLYTLLAPDLIDRLERFCRSLGVPSVNILDPVMTVFQSYLGSASSGRAGAQHALNSEYFRRIEALNFTIAHDDGQMTQDLDEADIVLAGISRTSKTPTSMYLANRGIKTANVPIVPGIPIPKELEIAKNPLVIGLVASPERLVQIRQNRMLGLNADALDSGYTDKAAIAKEVVQTRKMCAKHGWEVLDVTRRSIEETAAAILSLYQAHREKNRNPD
ncbi:pyruvate, water dikinase regulatory protein [Coralliovum pocilloporae]|uniref:pyruvate, water dikinase regulatory protein n=1 Tax=Coralliovum pocilloporae TaxID=3066369 RepID=UPI0033070D99